jgi:hypothetical protein
VKLFLAAQETTPTSERIVIDKQKTAVHVFHVMGTVSFFPPRKYEIVSFWMNKMPVWSK